MNSKTAPRNSSSAPTSYRSSCDQWPALRADYAVFRFAAEVFYLIILLSVAINPTPAHSEQSRRVVSGPCPYTCEKAGIKGGVCREWRKGKKCYVEVITPKIDKSQAPKMPSVTIKASATPSKTTKLTPEQIRKINAKKALERCTYINPYYILPPRVTFHNVKDAGYLKQGQYYVRGTISGMCLQSAGYYEDDQLVSEIEVDSDTHYRNFHFRILFRADAKPEIRVYPVRGPREVIKLAPPKED